MCSAAKENKIEKARQGKESVRTEIEERLVMKLKQDLQLKFYSSESEKKRRKKKQEET